MELIIRLVVNAVAIWVATLVVDGIELTGADTREKVFALLVAAVIFGLVNAVIKPIVKLFALPLFILTLGLITFVINALMLWLTSWISEKVGLAFHVDGFWPALLGALVVTVVSFLLSLVLPDGD